MMCQSELVLLCERLPKNAHVRFVLSHRALEERALRWLSDSERLRINSFRSRKRRKEFLLGRAVARALISDRLDIPERDVLITVGHDGAPRIPFYDWRLSIAHSDLLAAAALFKGEIGVDVEPIVERRPDLYRYLLHPEEYPLLQTTGYRHNDAQILIWCIKEAVLKARRSGLRMSPKRLRVEISKSDGIAAVREPGGRMWLVPFERVEGHFISVATPAPAGG